MIEHNLIKQLNGLPREDKLQFILDTLNEHPEFLRFKNRLAKLYLKNGKFEEALQIIDEILNNNPNSKQALVTKATIFAKQGLKQEALMVCDTVLATYPLHLNILLLKSNLLQQNDLVDEAAVLYLKALKAHPNNLKPYARLSELIYQEGNIQEAIDVLDEGLKNVPNAKLLLIKKIQFNLSIANYNQAIELIQQQEQKESLDPQMQYFKAQIFQRKGLFSKAKKLVKDIKAKCLNDRKWSNKVDLFLAQTAFLEYNYDAAETILSELVSKLSHPNMQRNRLSLLLLLKGDLNGATKQLQTATKELEERKISGKVMVPLIGHSSKIINEFNINPVLKSKAVASFNVEGQVRLDYLAKLQLEDDNYFGTSLYLCNELRKQGAFEKIAKTLSKNNSDIEIPKTIIQYWDAEEIPIAVKRIMDSWKEKNPSYEHTVYSKKSAYYFLKIKISLKTANAFLKCKHPAMQADFFRLAYLSKFGGFYADADDKCLMSIEELRNCGADLVLKLGDFGCISNNFIGCAAGNEIISEAFNKGVENMLTYFNEGPWFRLGPGHFTKCVTSFLAKFVDESDFKKWPKLKIIDQIETRKFMAQHLSLPYKSSNKSWYTAAYKRQITPPKPN